MFFTEEKLEQIRRGVDIVELISGYLALRKSGGNFVGLCPFHVEKTPSFTVNRDKGIFYCFGCHAGGNVITFLMRMENLSFPEAARRLAIKAGVELPSRARGPGAEALQQMYRINELAAQYYHHLLMRGEEGREYLKGRGVEPTTISQFKLGYAPKGWENLVNYLNGERVSLPLTARLGLIIAKKGEGYFDRFRHRLIFPIFDVKGRVIGFGGRALGDEEPKYLNSPDSPIYKKGESLYGIHLAAPEMKAKGSAILVEGYFDLLSLYQGGIKNVVAPLGTALTRRQGEIIKGYCPSLFLLYDADTSGQQAARRSMELLLNSKLDTRVAILPAGEDPDSLIRREGAGAIDASIRSSKPLVDFLIGEATKELSPQDPRQRSLIVARVLEVLERMEDRIEQAGHIDRLAERLNLKPELILSALNRRQTGQGGPEPIKPSASPNREELLIALILGRPKGIERVMEEQVVGMMADPTLKGLAGLIIKNYQEGRATDPASLNDLVEEEAERSALCRLSLLTPAGDETRGAMADCIRGIKRDHLKKRERELLTAIREADMRGDQELLKRLLKEKKELDNIIGE